MVTRVSRSEIPNFKLKSKFSLWYLLVTRWLIVTIKHSQASAKVALVCCIE